MKCNNIVIMLLAALVVACVSSCASREYIFSYYHEIDIISPDSSIAPDVKSYRYYKCREDGKEQIACIKEMNKRG